MVSVPDSASAACRACTTRRTPSGGAAETRCSTRTRTRRRPREARPGAGRSPSCAWREITTEDSTPSRSAGDGGGGRLAHSSHTWAASSTNDSARRERCGRGARRRRPRGAGSLPSRASTRSRVVRRRPPAAASARRRRRPRPSLDVPLSSRAEDDVGAQAARERCVSMCWTLVQIR